jgi:two-component system, NtrC family, nitrogen regulation sensor histidine kinase NtrY
MGFKHFRLQCVVRVILLGLSLLVVSYLAVATSLFATMVLVAATIVYQSFSLIHYVETTNRQLTRFMQSIEFADLSQTFNGRRLGASFDELYRSFTDVTEVFRKVRAEREEQYRYLQTVVQHVGVGVITYLPNGDVEIMNTAARRLLDIGTSIHNLSALGASHPQLVERLLTMGPGERNLQKVGESQLSLYATEFKMQDRHLRLVSLQNIESELEEKEMEAWQNLIRVLTHEIMNSVTPIASLASTANDLLAVGTEKHHNADSTLSLPMVETEVMDDVRMALKTIQSRSEGLLHFVQAYRNLTRIRTPELQVIPVTSLFQGIGDLLSPRMHDAEIIFEVQVLPDDLEVSVDPEHIEQVLINLVTNAIQSVENRTDARIRMEAELDDKRRVLIRVTDNGPGILPDVLEKIFIPFFTTKQEGSGIGLSLSRQIMRMHRGIIIARSSPDRETTFTLRFP